MSMYEGPQNYEGPRNGANTGVAMIDRDRSSGAVEREMDRLRAAGLRLEKVGSVLAERLATLTVERTLAEPGGSAQSAPMPARCDLAGALSAETDHLEYVARRLEELLAGIDL